MKPGLNNNKAHAFPTITSQAWHSEIFTAKPNLPFETSPPCTLTWTHYSSQILFSLSLIRTLSVPVLNHSSWTICLPPLSLTHPYWFFHSYCKSFQFLPAQNHLSVSALQQHPPPGSHSRNTSDTPYSLLSFHTYLYCLPDQTLLVLTRTAKL